MIFLLDLSAAFDTADLGISSQRLAHVIRIKGAVLGWFRSHLSDRFQFVHVQDVSLSYSRISHRAPLILSTLSALPLGNMTPCHLLNLHFYADDTPLNHSLSDFRLENVKNCQNILPLIYMVFWGHNIFVNLSTLKVLVDSYSPESLTVEWVSEYLAIWPLCCGAAAHSWNRVILVMLLKAAAAETEA